MKSGRKPRYPFRSVQAAFVDPARINRTMVAAAGADSLGMDEQAVVDLISGLRVDDFDKSMRSEINPSVWQDVYKPVIDGREFYVKFTLDARGEFLLISFKENTT